jgi:hypothetical protein
MDYGKMFSRAWNLIWKNKALILLGMLAVLSGVGSGGGGSQGFSGGEGDFNFQNPSFFDFQYSRPWQGLGLPALAVGVIVLLVIVALALWAVGTIARGGLISGAVTADQGEEVRFGKAFRDGVEKGWRLIGIGLIPAIPVVLLVVSALISAGIYNGFRVTSFEGMDRGLPNAAIAAPVIAITCLLILLALGLSLLRAFANRACMLEDLGVLASYRRGFEVLGNNLGTALILYLLQILLSIGMGILLLAPLALSLLCCALWPLLWFAQGTFAAFYSTLWTLAWQQWESVVPAR